MGGFTQDAKKAAWLERLFAYLSFLSLSRFAYRAGGLVHQPVRLIFREPADGRHFDYAPRARFGVAQHKSGNVVSVSIPDCLGFFGGESGALDIAQDPQQVTRDTCNPRPVLDFRQTARCQHFCASRYSFHFKYSPEDGADCAYFREGLTPSLR
jgi:hypothetical protein